MHITKNSIKVTFLMMSLFILLYQIQQSAGSSIYNFLYCVILWLIFLCMLAAIESCLTRLQLLFGLVVTSVCGGYIPT